MRDRCDCLPQTLWHPAEPCAAHGDQLKPLPSRPAPQPGIDRHGWVVDRAPCGADLCDLCRPERTVA